MSDHRNKERVTLSLDNDILERARGFANVRRQSLSAWINNTLGMAVGLVHDESEERKGGDDAATE